jgi:non-homologous end joining protein Ku
MRAVHSSTIDFGDYSIPVKIYNIRDNYKLSASLFHDKCDEPVSRVNVHVEGEQAVEVDVFTAIPVNQTPKPLPTEIRNELVGKDSPIEVISSHRVVAVESMISKGHVCITDWFVAYPADFDKPNGEWNRNAMFSLLAKMKQRNRALLLRLGITSINRYAILFPNGRLAALSYDEEFRELPSYDGTLDPAVSSAALKFIDDILAPTPSSFSMKDIAQKVSAWFSTKDRTASPRTNPKKSERSKIKSS